MKAGKPSPSITTRSKPLWKHQKQSLRAYERTPIIFDTSDPGTGKTRVGIQAWYNRRKRGGKCMLVLAPRTLLQAAWGSELEEYFPDVRYSIARAENREEAFRRDADVYITNIDAVKWLAKQKAKFFEKFDTLMIDEITVYKHRTSDRSKAVATIRNYFKYRAGLTGTPNSHSITDVWHQVFILDDGKRLGTKFFAFRSATCQAEQIGPRPEHIQWEDKPGAEMAVAHLLSDISIRNEFEKCMDIPPNRERFMVYEPSAKLLKAYRQMEKETVLALKGKVVSAVNAAVLRNKLLQIASGAVYTGDESYEFIDDERYEFILDIVAKRKHSVVFFNWRHQRDGLVKFAQARGIEFAFIDGSVSDRRREEIRVAYQKGFYQTLFLQPETGAHGLTLTKGTATIWSSPVYRADFIKQGLHRIYRGGQTLPTETIKTEARGTCERKVYERVGVKGGRMSNFLEVLNG
jgi:superfamily II DNA or RNA helicase